MTTTRAAAGGLVAVALAVSTLGVPAAGAASAPIETTTVAVPDTTAIDFGQTVDIDLEVESVGGTAPVDGTSTLYAREGTSRKWRAVSTNASASVDFPSVQPRMTTTYKVVYHGHDATSADDDSYAPSTSATFTVGVARTITYPSGGFDLTGKVRPAYGRRVIVVKVSREEAGDYRLYRRIRTDRRGRYHIELPRRRGVRYWSFIVRADDEFRGTRFTWRTWKS